MLHGSQFPEDGRAYSSKSLRQLMLQPDEGMPEISASQCAALLCQHPLAQSKDSTTSPQGLESLRTPRKYMAKVSFLQLRACHKVRHHLSLQQHDRTKTNFDNELQENFCSIKLGRNRARELEKYCEELTKMINDDKAKVHSKFRNVQLAKAHYKLRNENENENENEKKHELVKYNLRSQLQQQLPTVTFKKKKEQLDNLQNAASFYSAASKTKLQSRLGGQLHLQDADSALGGQLIRPSQRASTGAAQEYTRINLADSFRSRIDHQLSREQLRRRDLQNGNFDQSSLEEETFNESPSQTAAWNQRPSERQLQRQQLDKRDLQQASFQDRSLTEETFSKTTSQNAA